MQMKNTNRTPSATLTSEQRLALEKMQGEEYGAEDKLFNFRPIFFFALFFILGIVYLYVTNYQGVSPWWGLAIIPIFAAVYFFGFSTAEKAKRFFKLISLVIAFSLGVLCFALQTNAYAQTGNYKGEYAVVGRVVGLHDTKAVLDNVYVDGNAEGGKLVAYLPAVLSKQIRLGDELVLHGYLQNRTEYTNELENVYFQNMQDNLRFTMRADSGTITSHTFDLFLEIRSALINTLQDNMDETTSSVTIALLTGETAWMDSYLLGNMRYGGIAHIFAVSGLHIGLLYSVCSWIINRTGIKHWDALLQTLLIGLVLCLYGGICGMGASVIRAIVMCLVFHFLRTIGSGLDSIETLSIAAITVLLLNPVSLLCVGFQLSFTACLGIFLFKDRFKRAFSYLGNRLENVFRKTPITDEERAGHPLTVWGKIREGNENALSITLSAQVATLPIQLTAFGYVSFWSVLLNFVLLPAVCAAFSLMLVLAILSCVFPFAAGVFLYVPQLIWSVLLLVFQVFDFSTFALQGVVLSPLSIVCYCVALLAVTDKWNLQSRVRWILFLAFLAVFVVLSCVDSGIFE